MSPANTTDRLLPIVCRAGEGGAEGVCGRGGPWEWGGTPIGRSMAEGAGLLERPLDALECDVAREGALEATREMPRAAALEVGRPSGRGCATPRCPPRTCDGSFVESISVEVLEAFDPFEWVYEYGCNIS